jgi:DNA-binding YbaB/EbfC family protein
MPDAPDLNALLQQAQAMQQKVVEAQERARQKTVEGSAGGGLVTVVVSGAMEVKSVKLDPQAVDPKDVALLEDLIAAAVNQALAKASEMMAAEMQSIAPGLNLPGLF